MVFFPPMITETDPLPPDPMHRRVVSRIPVLVGSLMMMGSMLAGCAHAPHRAKEAGVDPTEAASAEAHATAASDRGPESGPGGNTPQGQSLASSPIPVLRADHPETYVVQQGDTLWKIARVFLKDPWLWPEIWHVNPQVANPHLIYPGDRLVLVTSQGSTQITLERGSMAPAPQEGLAVVKLSPRVRLEPIEADKQPTMRYADIAAMLGRPYMLERKEAREAPYVLSAAESGRFLSGRFERIYARGKLGERKTFNVVRSIKPLRDPDKGTLLGFEAEYVATAQLMEPGDSSLFMLTESSMEVRPGDRLVPAEDVLLPLEFTPMPPSKPLSGFILSVYKGVAEISQYNVVSVSLGKEQGLQAGDLLAIYQRGQWVRDPVTGRSVKLPEQRAGLLLVFKPFDRVSYGLVLEAERSIHLQDRVATP